MSLLIVTGLLREARLLGGPGVRAIACGGEAGRRAAEVERLAATSSAIISIGLGGGLQPGLRPGDWVVAERISDGATTVATDAAWTRRLLRTLPGAKTGTIAGCDAAVAGPEAREALARATGALAADMESHIAARAAAARRLPFAAARVISDGAERTLPEAALAGMRPDGAMDPLAVMGALLRRPGELPALIRTALEAERAFGALLRGRRLLGPTLGAPGADLGELGVDVT